MRRTILTAPNSILNQTSQEVSFPLSRQDKLLGDDLQKMVDEDKGSAGLAAPQVGELKRMVVVSNKKKRTQLLINPQITLSSKDSEKFVEGCLSIPGKLFEVQRPKTIKYTYQDRKGRWYTAKATGWEARVILHEIDHLNGILISQLGKLADPDTITEYQVE